MQTNDNSTPTIMDWPWEIITQVLDLLPQHHIYPLLSLSKNADYYAKRRLFRQVYVIRLTLPLLHDDIEELTRWLFLAYPQLDHLLESGYKWPGKLVLIQSEFPENKPAMDAVTMRLKPARVIPVKYINTLNRGQPFRALIPIPQLPNSVTDVVRLSRLTLVGPHCYEPVPIKLEVDNLSVVGFVRGIEECIELSSVKQLSLVHAYGKTEGNIYAVAAGLTALKDLFICQPCLKPSMMKKFPKTVRQLVLKEIKIEPFACVSRFRKLLEYFEYGNYPLTENWPRPLRYTCSVSLQTLSFPKSYMPRLKWIVSDNTVYHVQPTSGNWLKFKVVNKYTGKNERKIVHQWRSETKLLI